MAEDVDNDDQWLYGDQHEREIAPGGAGTNENGDGATTIAEDEESYAIPDDHSMKTVDNDEDDTKEEDERSTSVDNVEVLKQFESAEAISNDTNSHMAEEEATEEETGPVNGDDEDLEDVDDDSDDDVNVVIGEFKAPTTAAATYSGGNTSGSNAAATNSTGVKRGPLLSSGLIDKSGKILPTVHGGKFTVDEFEQCGMINGVPAVEFNLDSLEDKPWRKPGADVTDYFNYGFNEDTWRAYCERQRRMRTSESGVGLSTQLNLLPRGGTTISGGMAILNDNSKYTGGGTFVAGTLRKAGPPPGRRTAGAIDVIGGGIGAPTAVVPSMLLPTSKMEAIPPPPKMNVIQVMTADRREYSRKPTTGATSTGATPSGTTSVYPDVSVPPPNFDDSFHAEYDFNPEPEPFYGSGYEPTQDSQWQDAPPPGWIPSDIQTLTPGPGLIGPPPPPPLSNGLSNAAATALPQCMPPPMPLRTSSPMGLQATPPTTTARGRSRSKERSVSRAHSERPRDRERNHRSRSERSRSRSRRHHHSNKSRSRSPSHRSHKKKKSSRRHDDSD